MKELRFDQAKDGRVYLKIPLTGDLLKKAIDKRCEIIDVMSGFDDKLADEVIQNDSLENVDSAIIRQAIRNLTINQHIVPVLLGSAYKNTGVQLLMDGLISYLPTPTDRGSVYKCFGFVDCVVNYCTIVFNQHHFLIVCRNDFAAKVFKVMHDKQRGALSLVRILNGTLKKGDKVTTSNGKSEIVQKIYEPLADEYREIDDVHCGNVGICAGLKVN